jgi:hypothetical protein
MVNGFERIGGTPAFEAKLNEWVTARTSTPIRDVALRYCATEHGWKGQDFHRMCDNINVPRLMVIARSTNGYVFGGFTQVGVGGTDHTYIADASAFLFTLINPHSIAPTMLTSNTKDNGLCGLRHCSDYGAKFGLSMMFCGDSHTNKGSRCDESLSLQISYQNTTGKGPTLFKFGTIAEILAFRV